MTVDLPHVGNRDAFQAEQTVANLELDIACQVEPTFEKKVVYLRDRSRCGVLDGKYRRIGSSGAHVFDRFGEGTGRHNRYFGALRTKVLLTCQIAI